MDIVITMLDGTSHNMRVNPQDSVKTLKIQIQAQLGVPIQNQKLILLNGEKTPLNDDTRQLGSYGVQPGSQVSLLVMQHNILQIFLRNEKGQTSTYDVKPDEVVANFQKMVESREKVPVSQQRLVYQGRELSEPRAKLSDYNIRHLDTIDLMFRLRGGCTGI